MNPPVRRRRAAAALALALIVLLGLVVHALLPASSATDVAGDALYAVAVYTGLVLLFARVRPAILGAVAAVWCAGVELFQLTGVPLALAGEFPPIALVLGTGFDPRDLVVYPLAVVTAAVADRVVGRRVGMTGDSTRLQTS